jgi:DNA-binding CsgD family transcriptional regulator
MQRDWLGVVEAAYRTDLDEQKWLDGVLDAARPMLDHRVGIAALLYDASSMNTLVPLRFITSGTPRGLRSEECMRLIQESSPNPEFLARTFGALSCGLVSQTFGPGFPQVLEHLRPFGVVDMLAVNGVDPSLMGCFLTGNLPPTASAPLASRTRAMWTRISAHLAAGYRVRRRLSAEEGSSSGVEAVLTPAGKVEHAEGLAREKEAREALRDSVQLLERVRTRLRRDDPEAAVSSWKGLVEARWSLLDHFETGGKRYVIARYNEAAASHTLSQLSAREQQVVAFVALGHANKVIAYELGLSPSTVGVLITRASRKLGVRSRSELASAYDRLSQASS